MSRDIALSGSSFGRRVPVARENVADVRKPVLSLAADSSTSNTPFALHKVERCSTVGREGRRVVGRRLMVFDSVRGHMHSLARDEADEFIAKALAQHDGMTAL